jgi:cytochrome c oxidase cbb3-type subunit I/II
MFKTIQSAPETQEEDVYQAPRLTPTPDDFQKEGAHRYLEGTTDIFIILTVVAVVIGSVIEILPSLVAHHYTTPLPNQKPYTALELAGRDLYIREGCYNCHSQLVRPLEFEILRYGDRSLPEEGIYDRPFQWGSKRTGPDLARVGGKYPDIWHFRHMLNPRDIVPKSIMPAYPWLFENTLDFDILRRKLSVLKGVGVPYTQQDVEDAVLQAKKESKGLAENLEKQGISKGMEKKEIIALIAYLQRLHLPSTQHNVTADITLKGTKK